MKRLMSLLLAAMLIASSVIITAGAEKEVEFSDIDADEYFASSVETLASLGILNGYEDGTFKAENKVTRAEMAAVIVRMLGMEKEAEDNKGKTDFDDVDKDHWASGYINTAVEEGIINGDGDGKFRPEDEVKHEEAIKMVVCAEGLGDDVKSSGANWAKPYLEIAEETGISDGLETEKGEAATRGDVAVMVYNGLSAGLEAPEFSLKAGNHTGTQNVTITTATENGRIYYTTDGSEPTIKSALYEGPISVSKSSTLKAITVKHGIFTSEVTEAKYIISHTVPSGGGGSVSKYAVSFDLNYEGADNDDAPAKQNVKKGSVAIEPDAPEREGYIFLGWFTDKDCQSEFNFSSAIVKKTSLYAGWTIIGGENSHNVTFLLNDGTAGAYDMQVVPTNGKVTKPIDPERDMYIFRGWYEEPAGINMFDFNSEIKGETLLYAKWGNPESTEDDEIYSASSGTETVYSITGIDIVDNTATITVNANSKSVLLVKFLDENTEELLTTTATYTPDYCEMVGISLQLPSNLPEYYIVEAQLFDNANSPLCECVRFIQYTSVYEEFLKQTVDDFEGQIVLNFDDDKTNNFGVLNVDTKLVESSDTENILIINKSANGVTESFIFENPSDAIKELKKGDTFYVADTEYMVKVSEISVDEDGNVIIIPDADVEMTDFYDVIKVDMKFNTDDDVERTPEKAEDVEADLASIEDINISGDWSTELGQEISYKFNDAIELSLNVSGKSTVAVEMIYDLKLFREDYFYCSITEESEFDVSVTLTASIDNSEKVEKAFEGKKIPIKTPIPGLDVYVQPLIPVEWEIKGEASFDFKLTQKSGFVYDSYSGEQKVDEKSHTLSFKLEGSAEVSFGPKIKLGVGWGKKGNDYIVECNIGAQIGIKISATAHFIDANIVTNQESIHGCDICIDGEAKLFVNVTAEFKYHITDKFSGTPLKGELFSYETWLTIFNIVEDGKFYISLKNDADSLFGGKWHLGAGECPNQKYRISFVAKNSDDEEISKNISVIKQNGESECSGTSKFTKYLYNGNYVAIATIENENIRKTFIVNDAAQTVTLTADSKDGKIIGKVVDSETNENISGAMVVVKCGGNEVASTTSSYSGEFSFRLPAGVYTIEVSKEDYTTYLTVVEVTDNEEQYVRTTIMVKDKQDLGGFSGKIIDAVTGEPIEGVTLTLRKGSNNTSEGDILETYVTNSNGQFASVYVVLPLVNKVIVGFDAGYYTLVASKEGYVTSSFDIYVRGGECTETSWRLSPIMTDDEYRFILTWGADPRDLDSHLVGPTPGNSTFHTWYGGKNQYENGQIIADLDLDDITSYGPETTTIRQVAPGKYFFYVHHYSGNGTIATSGACVAVYKGSELIREFYAPTNGGDGRYWNVCTLDTLNGTLTPNNTITNAPTTSSASLMGEELGEDEAALVLINNDIATKDSK